MIIPKFVTNARSTSAGSAKIGARTSKMCTRELWFLARPWCPQMFIDLHKNVSNSECLNILHLRLWLSARIDLTFMKWICRSSHNLPDSGELVRICLRKNCTVYITGARHHVNLALLNQTNRFVRAPDTRAGVDSEHSSVVKLSV